jgi:hypothetical protein
MLPHIPYISYTSYCIILFTHVKGVNRVAKKSFRRNNPSKIELFDKKVEMFKNWGYDDYCIKYIKRDSNSKREHILLAVKNGRQDADGFILTSKDKMRKMIEKFMYMNKMEFTNKMKQNEQKLFPKIKPDIE